jgi:hypothetical protein
MTVGIAEEPAFGLGDLAELTIAIYDDNREEALSLEIELGDLGVGGVVVLPTEHRDLGDAVQAVRDHANAAVCDHVLRIHSDAEFTGAEMIEGLIAADTPSVLVTAFAADVGMDIRPHLPSIPAFIRRAQLSEDPVIVVEELRNCRIEMLNGRPAHREAFRTPIYIERSATINGAHALDARISSWQLDEVVQFPARMLGDYWADNPDEAVGQIFFAHVNLGARRPEELFLEHLEPDPADFREAELHFS